MPTAYLVRPDNWKPEPEKLELQPTPAPPATTGAQMSLGLQLKWSELRPPTPKKKPRSR